MRDPRCPHVFCRRPSRSPAPLPERAAFCQPGPRHAGNRGCNQGGPRQKEVQVIFDRGGFDHRLFKWLDSERIGFVTYQRGRPDLPESSFSRKETRFEGRRLRFDLAEDMAWVNGKGPWRRVVVRAKNGHQLPIITNLDVPGPRLTCLMRARWRQENLFKYMVEHYGLDHLISHGADPADPKALIPNPEITRLERQIAELRQLDPDEGLARPGCAREGTSPKCPGLKDRPARGRLVGCGALEVDITKLKAAQKALPSQVTIAESATGRVVLRGEHKAIVDRVKITAYNAEEWLLERLGRHYQNPNDVHDLLRSFAELPGDIRTTSTGVIVTLYPPNTPIHRRALQGLIDDLMRPTLPILAPIFQCTIGFAAAEKHSRCTKTERLHKSHVQRSEL